MSQTKVTPRKAIDLIREICGTVKESSSTLRAASSFSYPPTPNVKPIAAPVAIPMHSRPPIEFLGGDKLQVGATTTDRLMTPLKGLHSPNISLHSPNPSHQALFQSANKQPGQYHSIQELLQEAMDQRKKVYGESCNFIMPAPTQHLGDAI